ncbi:hypothetical protein K469DRAFT_684313 [Zopfia rhizophila CBS 207.26]|uniref:Uncharacterized protein n=1 Tax=Zopfia rhizophila CBS 207.26 TaxID=1314779 RepID=A0A6A6EGQ5_9PEZI|nr:hypothetical protein K469DRAFT_684313 [Zopfia rhizophila CBS 207.26]
MKSMGGQACQAGESGCGALKIHVVKSSLKLSLNREWYRKGIRSGNIMRTDVSELERKHRELAKEFVSLRDELNSPADTTAPQINLEDASPTNRPSLAPYRQTPLNKLRDSDHFSRIPNTTGTTPYSSSSFFTTWLTTSTFDSPTTGPQFNF